MAFAAIGASIGAWRTGFCPDNHHNRIEDLCRRSDLTTIFSRYAFTAVGAVIDIAIIASCCVLMAYETQLSLPTAVMVTLGLVAFGEFSFLFFCMPCMELGCEGF